MSPDPLTSMMPADGISSVMSPAIGFKDWAVICEALGTGRQSLILRKGGIAEGRDGFRFKHERFFLFPTGYHQQFDKVRIAEVPRSDSVAATDAETVEIRYLFVSEFASWLNNWGQLTSLAPWHIWREDAIHERFEYGDEQGLQCAFGRVYQCGSPWTFPNQPAYGGCRSWVTLPAIPPELDWFPTLDDATHEQRRQEIYRLIRAGT